MKLSWGRIKRASLGPVVFLGFGAGVLSQVKRYDQRPELKLFLSVVGAGCVFYGLHHGREENRARNSTASTPDPPQPQQQIGSPSPPLPLVSQRRWSPREWLQSKRSLPRRLAIFFAIYLAAAALISIRVPVVVAGVAYENGGMRAYSYDAGEYAFTLMTKKTSAKQAETGHDPYAATAIPSPSSGSPPPPDPMKPRRGDIFDQVTPAATKQSGPWNDYAAAPSSQGTPPSSSPTPSAPVNLLAGEFEDAPVNEEPVSTLDVDRYAFRLEFLFVVIGALWFGIMPYYSKLKRCAWLLPLFVYAIAAIWRLLYVPCIWVVPTHYTRPARVDGETRALWDIGTAQVRYGLVFFEEFVLLVIVVVYYGCAIVVIRHLWPDKQIFPFLGRPASPVKS
jgi:hypothetical protein